MFYVDDDMTIYVTRGDTVFLSVTADDNGRNYVFQPGDVVRIKVTEKKACENVMFQKDFPVTQATERVDILLTEEETKIGEVISKPTDYWYEIELNPYTNPQTIVGYDDDGAKIFKLFPEGRDLGPDTKPEDVPVVDTELSLTSQKPVENQAVTRAIVKLGDDVKNEIGNYAEALEKVEAEVEEAINKTYAEADRVSREIAVERARITNLARMKEGSTTGDAELADIRVGADGKTYATAGEAVRGQIGDLSSVLSDMKREIVLNGSVGMYANGSGVTKPRIENFDMYEPVSLTNGYKSIVVKNAKVNPYVKRFVFANTETLSLETSYTCINLDGNDADSFNGKIDIPKDYKFLFIAKNCSSDGVLENEAEYELTYDMEEVVGSGEVIQMLNLPEHYDIFVGDTLEIFYENIILAKNIDDIIVEVDCNVGQAFKSKYLYTPTENEKWNTFDFTVTLKDNSGRVIERGSTVINTVYKNPNGTFANVLCVGDSLTVNGKWVKTFKDRLTQSGYNYVNLLGSCEYEGVNYEGYGGWTYNSYNTPNTSSDFVWVNCTHSKTAADQHSVYTIDSTNWKIETIEQNRIKFIRVSGSNNMPNSGVMTWVSGGNNHDSITFSSSALANGNPFWDDTTGKVDFAKYMTRIGHDGELIDYCIVFLGWNQSTDTKEQFKNSVNTFCNNLRASYPDCKIIFIGLQVPSYDGIGNNYGCSWKWFEKKSFVFNVDKWYKEIISVLGDSTAIQLCGQFDTENNMPNESRQVNKRNPKTEIYGTNGVHPNDYGYMQIGDVIFNAFMSY